MPVSPARTRLEQKLRAARLSQRDVLRRFPEEATRIGEGEIFVSERQLKRWIAGGAPIPRPVACRVLEAWFGEPVERLLGAPDAIASPDPDGGDIVEEAGRRAVEHAIEAAGALDDSALEHLHAAAGNAAHAYLTTPPLQMLTDLVALRDTIYAQLDRTHKPRQQAELYLLAGQVCGLLSSVTFDLGHPGVAEELARAAHTYGSVIDHPSLCSWARALQANMHLWTGRPRETVEVATAALGDAPTGTARARLRSVRARAVAILGGRAEVAADLAAAASELDRAGADELMDGIGGEFGFSPARHALCVGAAFLALGDAPGAEKATDRALRLFASCDDHERWEAGSLACSADRAAARLLLGDVAGTGEALRPVLALVPERRTQAIVTRLRRLDAKLARLATGDPRGRELSVSINVYCAESVRQVRSAVARPGSVGRQAITSRDSSVPLASGPGAR